MRNKSETSKVTYPVESKGRTFLYHTHGIKKGRCHSDKTRSNLIEKIVRLNPNIIQTHILKIVGHFDSMSTRTAEKILHELKKNKKLSCVKHGRGVNSQVTWIPATMAGPSGSIFFDNVVIRKLDSSLQNLETSYQQMTLVQREAVMTHLFSEMAGLRTTLYLHLGLSFD